ncbi:Asp-tRNA(Asn)/Glu-tRNA(Gln) amidotransferase subunit GatC [Candidatus Acetothermia bacterium]|nr:Asp-tRNA(Asn)/Glu-tRNA(Gln) amidotransferase subunit GatC [Candidatus Acetothermia bacterium]MBI3459388.1 Asp-tRNA(Asn)/Glu-tRNA(Gln) amidotransferase subunit GatC [Candidatus Acetothermia bacterium]MBI3659599.1 Asp-tRNA(Asn)/Glu-tRNA(Gln) amidotransferase subunit GatC [Candidatus Acetothermia bacterium]
MISREEVLHIARLAKLKLSEDEITVFQKQLGQILDYFKKLEEIDTSQVSPMKHILDVHNVLRADEPGTSLPIEAVLKNAPKRRENFFEVPKIVDKE